MTLVRVPAGKSGRASCCISLEHLGPLFAGKRGRCRGVGEWSHEPSGQSARYCTEHMLEIVAAHRAHNLRTTGHGAPRPSLCGGYHFCRDWQVCQQECDGDGGRRGCRAQAQPAFAHVRTARAPRERRNSSWRPR